MQLDTVTTNATTRAFAYRILSNAYFHTPYGEAASKAILDARTRVVHEMSARELCDAINLDNLTRY